MQSLPLGLGRPVARFEFSQQGLSLQSFVGYSGYMAELMGAIMWGHVPPIFQTVVI